ncbi:hypothetical protein J2X43_004177 [Rhizobium sp. BE258]|nr:hypothetical protein [Rhizobium sp. BE258]
MTTLTSSYLFLTAPDGADTGHEKTRVIRDGFTFLGFFFPWLWLLAHRLWLHAAAAFLAQAIGGVLMERQGLWPAGFAITLAASLIVALEGQSFRIRSLAAKGWNEDAVVTADSVDAAEEIYFSGIETIERDSSVPAPEWERHQRSTGRHGNATSLGLFGFDGGR